MGAKLHQKMIDARPCLISQRPKKSPLRAFDINLALFMGMLEGVHWALA
jgi:hypothetical protein